MDFLDKLAILLSGNKKQAHPPQMVSRTKKVARTQVGDIKTTSVNEQSITENAEKNIISKKIIKKDIDENGITNLRDAVNSQRISFGDTLIQNDEVTSYNDTFIDKNILGDIGSYDNEDKGLLNKVMPFLDTNTDMGVWVFKNRYGIIATMTIYILVVGFMVFGKISIKEADLSNSIYIDIPLEEIEEKIEEKKPEIKPVEQDYDDQPVENVMVDKNMELDTQLKDDRKTETSDLYREALETQEQLEANRKAYESGLESVSDITIDKEKHRVADRRQKPTNKSINKLGNVTVSYDLKNRFVVEPEIPAYRCKGAGKVEVEITVGQNGIVSSASIKSLQNVEDQCLPEMAMEAAKMTLFNIDYDAPQKQTGVITFIFVAQ